MESLLIEIKKLEREGYNFFPAWTMDMPITPERVKLPSGEILDISEMMRENKKKLVFGDKRRLLIINGLDFYDLVMKLDDEERYGRYNLSFEDDKDVANCRVKYGE